jgi:hypothetical protein
LPMIVTAISKEPDGCCNHHEPRPGAPAREAMHD